jgi:hypothetical protein
MIELRADGSLQGKPKIGRIYKMCNDGVLNYRSFSVELESDWPPYIEKYAEFRGFVTGFIPVDEMMTRFAECGLAGFTQEEKDIEKVAHLKSEFLKARDVAEKAAHVYFTACPVGPERIKASEIYENIRNATRT